MAGGVCDEGFAEERPEGLGAVVAHVGDEQQIGVENQ
jgi:hypothetical protein